MGHSHNLGDEILGWFCTYFCEKKMALIFSRIQSRRGNQLVHSSHGALSVFKVTVESTFALFDLFGQHFTASLLNDLGNSIDIFHEPVKADTTLPGGKAPSFIGGKDATREV